MKKLLFLLLFVVGIAHAQGNLGSNSSPIVNRQGAPLAGVNIAACQPLATTGASVTANLATLTMASNPQTAGFVAGQTILVSGFTGADTYFNVGSLSNGVIVNGATISAVTATTITFPLTHANGTASTNGTVLQMGNATTSCAALAAVYSDSGLTTPVSQPFQSDNLGNWNVFAATGTYYVQFYSPGIVPTLKTIMVGGGGGANPAGNAGDIQMKSGTGLGASHINDNGSTIISTENVTLPGGTLNGSYGGNPAFSGYINSSLAIKGPRPYIDTTAYGDSLSNQTTTGSINSGTSTLTLTSALDFANGQGVAVFGAGPTSALSTPAGASGSQVATVATLATNSGPTAGTHGISCTGTTATATTYGWHGFPASSSVTIAGAGVAGYNGTHTITLGANNYTFTFTVGSCLGNSDGGTATLQPGASTYKYQIVAEDANSGYSAASSLVTVATANTLGDHVHNHLTWTAVTNATQYLVYTDKGLGGALTCLGPAFVSVDATSFPNPYYDDYGSVLLSCPANAPTNPPGAATAGILIATINSGGGTTTLTLSSTASNTATTQTVQHDETTAINNAIAAAAASTEVTNGGGNIVILPLGTHRVQNLVFPATAPVSAAPMVIKITGQLRSRQPIVLNRTNYQLVGNGGGGGAFSFGPPGQASIDATGLNPVVHITGSTTEVIADLGFNSCPGHCIAVENTSLFTLKNVSLKGQTGAPDAPLWLDLGFGGTLANGTYISGTTTVPSIDSRTGGITMSANMGIAGFLQHCDVVAGAGEGTIHLVGTTSSYYEAGHSPLLTLDPKTCPIYDVAVDNVYPADPVQGEDVAIVNVLSSGNNAFALSIRNSLPGNNSFPNNQILEGANVSGYLITCGIPTSGCTGIGSTFQAPAAGMFQDNQGGIFLTNSTVSNTALHLREKGTSGALLTIENPPGTVVSQFNFDGGLNLGLLSTSTNNMMTGTAQGSGTSWLVNRFGQFEIAQASCPTSFVYGRATVCTTSTTPAFTFGSASGSANYVDAYANNSNTQKVFSLTQTGTLLWYGGANTTTLQPTAPTAARTVTLQDMSGTVPLMVYNTQSASTATNIAATNMVASTSALHHYTFNWTISLTSVGTSCTGNTTVEMHAIFTDPNAAGSVDTNLGTITLATGNNGTLGFIASGVDTILTKSGTAVQYATENFTAGTGCAPAPSYQVTPTLSQLW